MPRSSKQQTAPGTGKVETTLEHESETLDEGLEESFPASDPVAVSVTRVGAAGEKKRAAQQSKSAG